MKYFRKEKKLTRSRNTQVNMAKKNEIKLFEDRKVRTLWDSDEEKWYISIVDVIAVLTDSKDPTAYWLKLKQRL